MSYGGYQQPYGQGGYPPQPPPPQGYYGQPPAPPPGQQQGYYQQPPPPQQYGYGSPAPPQPYGQTPPQQGYNYGPPPPQQYNQPYGQPPPHSPQPPQQYGYGAPPPGPPPPGQQPYGQPQYGAPPQQYGNYPPTPPSLGYGPPQIIQWDGNPDAQALRQAMKGFGTDERALIRILAPKDPLQINTIRDSYHRMHRRDLIEDLKKETSGWFETGLVALARGPLMHDVFMLRDATDGPGTKEKVLNDVLLGRSNADIRAIKSTYQQTFRQSLESAIKADLSFKTERHFMIVLQATRNEDSVPVSKPEVDRDVEELYNATEGRMGTDEMKVCSILTTRNDNQIRAIALEYQKRYARNLEDVIKREFSGHMEDALLFQLRHGADRYMHQAQLLEDAMAGAGTKDHLLVSRVVRAHWDRSNMANVRGAYEKRYRRNLASRIKGETSGDYERLLLACIGEPV
ncbi:Annexin [Pleurostoma richardsiae]|uniref:Annexin n=1 Tax=Pleurostoma richardsiae TaxID=41990 RepID=A0AA38VPB4_9PEZI|nr:Annexin [Pleurostoma richardsiae]